MSTAFEMVDPAKSQSHADATQATTYMHVRVSHLQHSQPAGKLHKGPF